MNTYSKLQKQYMLKQITEEEYKKRKAIYLETILEMYCLGYLSTEELYKRVNTDYKKAGENSPAFSLSLMKLFKVVNLFFVNTKLPLNLI